VVASSCAAGLVMPVCAGGSLAFGRGPVASVVVVGEAAVALGFCLTCEIICGVLKRLLPWHGV